MKKLLHNQITLEVKFPEEPWITLSGVYSIKESGEMEDKFKYPSGSSDPWTPPLRRTGIRSASVRLEVLAEIDKLDAFWRMVLRKVIFDRGREYFTPPTYVRISFRDDQSSMYRGPFKAVFEMDPLFLDELAPPTDPPLPRGVDQNGYPVLEKQAEQRFFRKSLYIISREPLPQWVVKESCLVE